MTGITKGIDYQLLIKEYDGDVPTSYVCEIHQNQSESVTVEYFYDLVHANCSIDSTSAGASSVVSTVPLEIADLISQRLLQTAAETWHILPSGESCLAPTIFDDAWLVGVSTVTTTTTPTTNGSSNNGTIPTITRVVSDFGCRVLTPNTTTTVDECCHVIRSEIIFRPSGGYNQSKLVSFVHEFIDATSSASAVDGSFMYRAASIEPQFDEYVTGNDEARNNLKEPNRTSVQPPSDPAVDAITQQSPEGRNDDITVTGGFLIASFISVMVGVFIVLFRRHRKNENSGRGILYDVAIDDTFREKGEDDDDDIHVTVVNDPNYNSFPVKRQLTCRSCVTETENDDGGAFESELLDHDDMDHPVSPKYAFDLGQSLKMKVMGTYAPTTIPVVAPYPLNGNFANMGHSNDMDLSGCDSEAEDSWAQTDGTVGSIEERLEEITAEI
jgi:hypothetical protein